MTWGDDKEVERLNIEVEYLEARVEKLTKLTDYLRAGEVNIDEQERMWNAAQADLVALRALARAVFMNPLDIDAMLALGEALRVEEVTPIQTDP